MKVKCPQCGRIFDVAVSQQSRQLRCVCKSLFAAQEFILSEKEMVPNKDRDTDPQPKKEDSAPLQESRKENDIHDEQTVDPQTDLSDTQINRYIESLAEQKNYISQVERKTRDEKKPLSKARANPIKEIEVVQPPPRPRTSKEELIDPDPQPSDEIPEPLIPQPAENTIYQAQEQLRAREAAKRKAKEDLEVTVSIRTAAGRIERLFKEKPQFVLIGVGTIFVLILAVLIFHPKSIQEDKVDPYLSKLLTPQATEPKRIGDEPNPSPPVVPVPSVPVAGAAPPVAASAESADENAEPDALHKMRLATYRGDYEDVIRIGAASDALMGEEGRALLLEAQLTRAGKNRNRLREIYEKLAEERRTHPNASTFLRTQAVAMLRNPVSNQDLYTALDILKSLSLTRSRDPLVFSYCGQVYERLGRLDLAHSNYEQAVILEPKYTWIIEHRVQLYNKSGKQEMASEMAERLATLDGNTYDGLVKLGEISFKKGQAAQGIAHYRKAIQLDDRSEARLALGIHLYNLGRYKDAGQEFSAGIRKTTKENIKRELYFQMGASLCQTKTYQEAFDSFQKALAVKGAQGAARILARKGECELAAGLPKRAIQTFHSALRRNPNAAEVWLSYGIALVKANQQKAALEPFRRAAKLKPSEQSYYWLGYILVISGQKKDAKRYLEAALKMNPKNKEIRQLLAKAK